MEYILMPSSTRSHHLISYLHFQRRPEVTSSFNIRRTAGPWPWAASDASQICTEESWCIIHIAFSMLTCIHPRKETFSVPSSFSLNDNEQSTSKFRPRKNVYPLQLCVATAPWEGLSVIQLPTHERSQEAGDTFNSELSQITPFINL